MQKQDGKFIYNATLRYIRIFASWTFLRWPYHLIHRGHNFYCCYISVQNLLFMFTLIVSKLNLLVIYNVKFSPCWGILIVHLKRMFFTQDVGIFTVCPHNKFPVPGHNKYWDCTFLLSLIVHHVICMKKLSSYC